MDDQLKLPEQYSNNYKKTKKPWLPYLIAIIGSAISLVIWYFLIYNYKSELLVNSFYISLPWIILISGVSIACIFAIYFRLVQLIHERSLTLKQMDADFKKEIIERMNAEEGKQKLEISLLQGQKLQAIGTLAGGIAHDFNNILYAIIGYTEMAQEDVMKESLVYKNLGKVLDAAKRGQDLVARILAFGRRHIHHEFKPIHLNTIIENILALLKPTIPASVIIDLQGSKEEYIILGDQTQLHQVIVNIINNAVDAMEDEGIVTMRITRLLANNTFLSQFPDLIANNYYKIDIHDTGRGMDQTTLERIFEPFFTTKEVGKGTGLGLSTVHAILKEHHGAITVESQLGHGTTFTLLLPEYQPDKLPNKPKEQTDGHHITSGR